MVTNQNYLGGGGGPTNIKFCRTPKSSLRIVLAGDSQILSFVRRSYLASEFHVLSMSMQLIAISSAMEVCFAYD